ncbi:MAG: DNA (cytosine-5-)-methyltransferase [Bacilli bacterium]|nr:DNA (cytosine-5-)-methyltransferase [Bacilli bacterium]
MNKLKGVSLFANVGIAETYLNELGIEILVANEIDSNRAKFYTHLYEKTEMIIGDITSDKIRNEIVNCSINKNIDFLIATPPCQGMSLAGKMDPLDQRNQLIYYAIDIIKRIKPKYVLLENVPQLLKTKIRLNEVEIYIPDYIHKELDSMYNFAKQNIVSAKDYEVPQMRKRNIFLLSRKDMNYIWEMPEPKKNITLRDAIYNIPSIDPILKEGMEETLKLFPDFYRKQDVGLKISKYHYPPTHAKKHVIAMMHTPSGETAFNNTDYYPKKDNGIRVNGHYNTYRRFEWDKPSRTITQNNGVISSLCCVHPGRKYKTKSGEILYSDPRVLTIYELLIVFSLPKDWNIPNWASEKMIRQVIGEGIPPMLIKNIAKELVENM